MRKHRISLLAALLVVGAALVAPTAAAGPVPDPSPVSFGSVGKSPTYNSIKSTVLATEDLLNRPMATIRVYEFWDTTFPQSDHRWLRNTGHTIYLSVKSELENGTIVPWREVADAPKGSAIHKNIVRWARKLRDFGDPIHFTFNHEPETTHNTGKGTPRDYRDAWKRIVKVFRAKGADDNVTFTWILTDHAFRVGENDRRYAPNWWPGESFVEEMGADVYNWFECRPGEQIPWRSPDFVMEGFRLFGAQYPNIPMSLPEWATVEDPDQPDRKAEFIERMAEMLQEPQWSQMKNVMYFNRPGTAYPTCDWSFDSSESSRAALEVMGADPWYQRSESINYPG